MKRWTNLVDYLTKVGVLGLIWAVSGCHTLKKVAQEEWLLTENSLYVDNEKVTDNTIRSLILQKPNSRVLGYPLRLQLYNLARKEGKLLARIGEAPTILDTALIKRSVERLEAYYDSKGYFNNSGDYTVETNSRKRTAKVVYNIALQKPYIIDTVTRSISIPVLDSLYSTAAHSSLVKPNEPFDLAQFNLERERLTKLFRNAGVYNFQESSIAYDILRDTTRIANDQHIAVQLNIQNPIRFEDNNDIRDNYAVHRFKNINIYADYDANDSTDTLKSIVYDNYTIFYNHKLRYRPKALTNAIFFEKDSVYRDVDRTRTYKQLTNLNTFEYPNLQLIPDTTRAVLTSNIYLKRKPKYALNLNFDVTHSNIQQVGTALGVTAVTRNVFGGAETLNISARGAIGLLSDAYLSDRAFTSELGGNINIIFPRIWFPLNTEKIIPYYMLPQSRFSAGTNFQRNIGLDKQSLSTIFSYSWSATPKVKHNIELLNVEFVRNLNPGNFFNVYQNTYDNLNSIANNFEDTPGFERFYDGNFDLIIPQGADAFIAAVTAPGFQVSQDTLALVRSIEERRERLTENNLIFASNYTYTKNSKTSIGDADFYQYRIKVESAGNFLSLIDKVAPYEQNDEEQLLLFGIPFSQYLKTELNFIRHWQIVPAHVIAFRSFMGLAVPYGNSDNIPFVRSYFAGGSNDNRAWNAYELGPGRTDNIDDFNEANLKLAFNLEYRFPIAGDIKGALFADAGNIWNVFDNEENPDAIFHGFSSLADIALGTGLGLRYDFTYLVFRLDLGFKTYNPAEVPGNRWFRSYSFRDAVLNIGINYPF